VILRLGEIVTLFSDQVTVGVGRPIIRQVSLNNDPRVTDVVVGGELICGLPAVYTGNESVPKIIINYTIKLFLNCNQHFGNFKP